MVGRRGGVFFFFLATSDANLIDFVSIVKSVNREGRCF